LFKTFSTLLAENNDVQIYPLKSKEYSRVLETSCPKDFASPSDESKGRNSC